MSSSGDQAAVLYFASSAIATFLAGLVGCAQSMTPGDGSLPPAVSLRVTDAAGLQEILDKHRGKVVLVDFWATWCGPCVEQFPHTVQLAEKLRDRGLAVVSVSMDSPSSEPQVRAFLEKQQARFDNLLSSYGSPVTATKEFGLPGPVPCYRVYDRQGRLHRQFVIDPRAERQFTTADVDAAVEELL
jgi:thiol-disulfide isomerase/thioredoxin